MELPKRSLSDWHIPGEWRRLREALQDAAAGQDRLWLERALAGARLAFRSFQDAALSLGQAEGEGAIRHPSAATRRGAGFCWQ